MSSLRSGIDELAGEDLDRLADEALEGDFAEVVRCACRLDAERRRRLAEIHRRETWRRDGYLSTASWHAHRFRMGWTAVTRLVREAVALKRMPVAARACSEGEVSENAVAALVQARDAHPVELERDEETLLEAEMVSSTRELRRALGYWRQALDGPKALEDAEHTFGLRRLHVSPTLGGMVRVDGDLDPETGQTVITALRAVMDAEARDGATHDLRTGAQRRADALGEICRRWLDHGARAQVAGERPHMTVLVDLETLEGRIGGTCETEDTGPLHPEAARRLACDASVSRVITRGGSEPLDVGRRTPVVPSALRRAVVVRDRHCRFPGCERPHPWCDAHHVVHRADGGTTALSNLTLLCRAQHRLVHEAGFAMQMNRVGPIFQDRTARRSRIAPRHEPAGGDGAGMPALMVS